MEKAREFQKNVYFYFTDYTKSFDCESQQIVENSPILIEMGVADYLTCVLKNLKAGQAATVRPDLKQLTGSKLGKDYNKAVYCHPAYLTYMQSTSCKIPDWMMNKLQSRLLGEISITSDMQMTPLYGRKQRRSKEPLHESERVSEKVGLKLNIQKTKITASGPIISWQIVGETMETLPGFIFLGSQITADGDCSHEIKRRLLLGRKVMTNLDSIFKSRERYYFANKGPSSQGYGFSSSHVWMQELDCEES